VSAGIETSSESLQQVATTVVDLYIEYETNDFNLQFHDSGREFY
jgi:hypothetical protein